MSIGLKANAEYWISAYRESAAFACVERGGRSGGGEVVGTTPQEFAAVIRQDSEKYAKLVKIRGRKRTSDA